MELNKHIQRKVIAHISSGQWINQKICCHSSSTVKEQLVQSNRGKESRMELQSFSTPREPSVPRDTLCFNRKAFITLLTSCSTHHHPSRSYYFTGFHSRGSVYGHSQSHTTAFFPLSLSSSYSFICNALTCSTQRVPLFCFFSSNITLCPLCCPPRRPPVPPQTADSISSNVVYEKAFHFPKPFVFRTQQGRHVSSSSATQHCL